MILIYGIDVLVTCLFLDYNICLLLHKNLTTHCHVCPMSKQIRAPFPITFPNTDRTKSHSFSFPSHGYGEHITPTHDF